MFHFDLNVYRFVKIKYIAGYVVEKHSHNFFHYFYILKGKGALEIGTENYEVNEGGMYLVPIGVEHSIIARKDCSFQTIEIKFIPSDSNIIKLLSQLPYEIKEVDPNIPYILEDLVHEASKKEIFYEDVINNKFTEIIIILMRKFALSDYGTKALEHNSCIVYLPQGKGVFDKVLKYIKDNIESRIEISELARISGFSEAHFCTIFKEAYNISPGQYINNLKLQKAKEYMTHSDLNISQIAYALGFQSVHYFSRFFKKKEGISPQEYIQKIKNNIFLELIDGVADNTKARMS